MSNGRNPVPFHEFVFVNTSGEPMRVEIQTTPPMPSPNKVGPIDHGATVVVGSLAGLQDITAVQATVTAHGHSGQTSTHSAPTSPPPPVFVGSLTITATAVDQPPSFSNQVHAP